MKKILSFLMLLVASLPFVAQAGEATATVTIQQGNNYEHFNASVIYYAPNSSSTTTLSWYSPDDYTENSDGSRTWTISFDNTKEIVFSSVSYAPFYAIQVNNTNLFTPGDTQDSFTLTPSNSAYPTSGGTINIYFSEPPAKMIPITISETNGISLTDVLYSIKYGDSNTNVPEANWGSFSVPVDAAVTLRFNTESYNITALTVNGGNYLNNISNMEYTFIATADNYNISITAVQKQQTTVSFVCDTNYDKVNVVPVGDASNSTTLSEANQDITFAANVSQIYIYAADNYIIKSISVSNNGTTTTYSENEYITIAPDMTITVEVGDLSDVVYTFDCPDNILTFSQSGNTSLTQPYSNGAYSIGKINFPAANSYDSGEPLVISVAPGYTDDYEVTSVVSTNPEGYTYTGTGGTVSVDVSKVKKNASFSVNLYNKKDGIIYTFKVVPSSAGNVLNITSSWNGNVTYSEDGYYTLTNVVEGGTIKVEMTTAGRKQYELTAVRIDSSEDATDQVTTENNVSNITVGSTVSPTTYIVSLTAVDIREELNISYSTKVNSSTSAQITVNFEAANVPDNATFSVSYMQDEDSSNITTLQVSADEVENGFTFVIGGLQPATNYTYTIYATMSVNGTAVAVSATSTVNFTTLSVEEEASTLLDLEIEAKEITSNSAILNVEIFGDDIDIDDDTEVTLYYRLFGAQTYTPVETTLGEGAEIVLSDLKVFTNYTYEFYATAMLDGNQIQSGIVQFTFTTDRATGINSFFENIGKGEIYNLNGMKVDANKLTRGIYIINGKKVLVK